MTAHVAERGEGRGRVVLRVNCAAPINESSIAAAFEVARAFGASIECLLLEDRQMFDAAAYAFAREVAFAEAARRPLAIEDISHRLDFAIRAAERHLAACAASSGVHVEVRRVRDTPVNALAFACQMSGPWNVVALGEVAEAAVLSRLDALFERVTGMTGVVVAGPRGGRRRVAAKAGPVVAVVEHADRLTGMLRTASRIAAVEGRDVVVALAAESRAQLAWLASEVNAALAANAEPRISVVALAQPGGGLPVVVEDLRRLAPAFVIAAFGGIAAPASGDLGLVTATLDCPLLLAR